MSGRLLRVGGWVAGARHASAEPLCTGRSRPYDESTLRKAARALSRRGAVPVAERLLQKHCHDAIGARQVTAFTDMYDQVYWTKKPAYAAPIGALGNRRLACTYFGMTFVRPEDGPCLAYHLSWHKPASPLLDGLQALHSAEPRHNWLTTHVAVHVLDRGTQGNPALKWCLMQAIPYLTLISGKTTWRRYRHPDLHTDTEIPIFVRPDTILREAPRLDSSQMHAPMKIVYPAQPAKGLESGRAITYRTAAHLSDAQVTTLDKVYKQRWPSNENPIKALVAVGFGANLDRNVTPTTSRGQDGDRQRLEEALAEIETKQAPIRQKDVWTPGEAKTYRKLVDKKRQKTQTLARMKGKPTTTKGTRLDNGAEHLCKLLTLILYNVLALWLWRSPIPSVRAMTPAMVGQLLLFQQMTVCIEATTTTLWVEPLPSPHDRFRQQELVRLLNAANLQLRGTRLKLKLREKSAEHRAVGS